jgi:tetratricopeptide (TPR) repeat protein
MERGNHPSMIPFLECAEALLINARLESTMSMASCHFALSACLQWLRDPEKARYHCDENIRISLMHGDEPNASIAYTELGVYYLTVEQYQEAIDTLQKSIDIQVVCGARETDPGLIKGARWLGTFPKCYSSYALLQLGRLEEAETLLIPVLEWFKKEWGLLNDRSYRTGFAMLHLGNVRAAQDRLPESFELHDMALRQYRMTLGNSHPHTAGAMLKVSDHYVRIGRKSDAVYVLNSH